LRLMNMRIRGRLKLMRIPSINSFQSIQANERIGVLKLPRPVQNSCLQSPNEQSTACARWRIAT
jgi:hypothetical protein